MPRLSVGPRVLGYDGRPLDRRAIIRSEYSRIVSKGIINAVASRL